MVRLALLQLARFQAAVHVCCSRSCIVTADGGGVTGCQAVCLFRYPTAGARAYFQGLGDECVAAAAAPKPAPTPPLQPAPAAPQSTEAPPTKRARSEALTMHQRAGCYGEATCFSRCMCAGASGTGHGY
jgi:hypothetical protein